MTNIKDSFSMINEMDMVLLNLLMEIIMRDIGKKIKSIHKGLTLG